MRQMLPASHPTCVNISGQTAAALNRRTVLSTTELPRRFRPPGWNSTARAHPTLAASLKLSTGAGFRPGCSLPAALPSTASIRAASHRPPTTPYGYQRPAPPHTSRACHPHRSTVSPPGVVTAAGSHPPRTPNRTSSCQQQIPQVTPRRRGSRPPAGTGIRSAGIPARRCVLPRTPRAHVAPSRVPRAGSGRGDPRRQPGASRCRATAAPLRRRLRVAGVPHRPGVPGPRPVYLRRHRAPARARRARHPPGKARRTDGDPRPTRRGTARDAGTPRNPSSGRESEL